MSEPQTISEAAKTLRLYFQGQDSSGDAENACRWLVSRS